VVIGNISSKWTGNYRLGSTFSLFLLSLRPEQDRQQLFFLSFLFLTTGTLKHGWPSSSPRTYGLSPCACFLFSLSRAATGQSRRIHSKIPPSAFSFPSLSSFFLGLQTGFVVDLTAGAGWDGASTLSFFFVTCDAGARPSCGPLGGAFPSRNRRLFFFLLPSLSSLMRNTGVIAFLDDG